MNARTYVNVQDFSVGVATTSTPILPAYFGRNFLLIKNNGAGACAVNLRGGTAALASLGNVQLASGQQIKFEKNVPQNAITAISASSSQLTVYADDSLPLPSFLFQTSPAPSIDLNFITARYWIAPQVYPTATFLNVVRAGSNATNLLPTSAAGATFTTFAANVARLDGNGLLVEEARTNLLTNSTAPVASQSPTCGIATFILWMNGSGSVTATAGTATAAALPLIATQGVPISFAVTVGGTVVVTTTGNVNAYQLEAAAAAGPWGTSLIVTAGASGTRAVDVINLTLPWLNGSASTLYGQGTPFQPGTAGLFNVVFAVDDATVNNRIQLYRSNTGASAGLVTNNTATQVFSSGAWTTAASRKEALAVASADQAYVFNGGTVVTGAVAWPPTAVLNRADIGIIVGGTPWSGYVERVAYWPATRLDNATLQSITS